MSRHNVYTGIAVVLGLVVVTLFFFAPNYLRGISMNPQDNQSQQDTPSQQPAAPAPSGSLAIKDVTVGTGATAQEGDIVEVQYVGKLEGGTVFDASSQHSQVMPGCSRAGVFCFQVGAGQVIPGWEQGLLGMKVGGERTLVIPPSLAYGANQVGSIPPNSTLTFDIKLLKVSQQPGGGTYVPQGPAAN